jgi:hypothetical protein
MSAFQSHCLPVQKSLFKVSFYIFIVFLINIQTHLFHFLTISHLRVAKRPDGENILDATAIHMLGGLREC